MNRLTPDGRLPYELCSVCKHEPYADTCTCAPANLLARGDITEEEAYRMIGVHPPPRGGHQVPIGARRQRGFWFRAINRTRLLTYRWQHKRTCKHTDVTPWYMLDADARQTRWCRACGYTEQR